MKGSYIIVGYIFIVFFFGIIKKVNCYESFTIGVKDGTKSVVNMFSTILTFVFAINLLNSSGLISYIGDVINFINLNPEILLQVITRPLSSSSSLTITMDVYESLGVDSYDSIVSTLIHTTTDTSFYIISLYYGYVGIKKIRHTLVLGLIINILGVVLSIMGAMLLFSL